MFWAVCRWFTICRTTEALELENTFMDFTVRRRLGIAIMVDGADVHGHARLCDNFGARWNARHSGILAAWRQVFMEAGGHVPDRNVERMLRTTHIPTDVDDNRRLDIIVPGLSVARGRPLFCATAIVTPISRTGRPRPGTSNRGGRLLEEAERGNNNTYHEVDSSGLGALYSLGAEVYGRWSAQCVELVPALARERARGLHPRVRRGTALGLQHRWWRTVS